MGLCSASLCILACAKSAGADFTSSVMIGRQNVYAGINSIDRTFSALRIPVDADRLVRSTYAEPFFQALGAKEIVSLDASDYEGSSVVHDLNAPLPDELRGRFTLVHDGGTLEHVFNFPQALKNCMQMLRVGGFFTQVICANNMMGHGFWQVSPELIYRVFTPANGFDVTACIVIENIAGGRWYRVTDPADYGSRVELCNAVPTFLLVVAKKISEADVFAASPQQSDYSKSWGQSPSRDTKPAPEWAVVGPAKSTTVPKLGDRLRGVSRPLRRIYGRFGAPHRGFKQSCYQMVSEKDVMTASFTTASLSRS